MKPQEIIQLVSQSVGIPAEEIINGASIRENADAKKLMAHFLSQHTSLILDDIGSLLGTGHSNICHMKNKLYQLIENDKRLKRIFNSIEARILQTERKEEKYNLDIPFLTHDIFIHLVKKTIVPGNDKQTIRNFSELYINNFIN